MTPTDVLDEDAVWRTVDSERLSLAALLDDLGPLEWATPSLCSGWRVREVAGHLALAHMGAAAGAVATVRARGSFNRMIRDTAVRHAAEPTDVLVGQIRAMVGSRRHAPGISHLEPLLDVLVHGQDIAVPLGRPRAVPVAAAAVAATRVWDYRWPLSLTFRARSRLRGLRLVATDVDWSVGQGDLVEGPVEALLLLLTGRSKAAVRRLAGPGVGRLGAPA